MFPFMTFCLWCVCFCFACLCLSLSVCFENTVFSGNSSVCWFNVASKFLFHFCFSSWLFVVFASCLKMFLCCLCVLSFVFKHKRTYLHLVFLCFFISFLLWNLFFFDFASIKKLLSKNRKFQKRQKQKMHKRTFWQEQLVLVCSQIVHLGGGALFLLETL